MSSPRAGWMDDNCLSFLNTCLLSLSLNLLLSYNTLSYISTCVVFFLSLCLSLIYWNIN
jgi:hypothetical protein